MSGGWEAEADRMVGELGPLPRPIAAAMRAVPRHPFVPAGDRASAYADEPLSLGPAHATISAPHMVALQLEAADLSEGDRVLEIGCGSGYLVALARSIVGPSGRVLGVEIDGDLAARSRVALGDLGVVADVRVADGCARLPDPGPFEAILVSFATPRLFPAWTAVLVDGGRLVAPVGGSSEQVLTTFRRRGDSGLTTLGPRCRFVPCGFVSKLGPDPGPSL